MGNQKPFPNPPTPNRIFNRPCLPSTLTPNCYTLTRTPNLLKPQPAETQVFSDLVFDLVNPVVPSDPSAQPPDHAVHAPNRARIPYTLNPKERVCVRESERERVSVCVRERECVCAREKERERERERENERERERGRSAQSSGHSVHAPNRARIP